MVLDGLATDCRITGDAGEIRHLGILARGDFKKTRECAHIARQCFGLDFLHEIGFGVCAQIFLRVVSGNRQRQCAKA